MCKKHTHVFVDTMAGSLKPLVEHMIGGKEFVALKDEIAQQMVENLPVAIRCVFYLVLIFFLYFFTIIFWYNFLELVLCKYVSPHPHKPERLRDLVRIRFYSGT